MKKRIQKRFILMIIFMLILPLLSLTSSTSVSAKDKSEHNKKHKLTISSSSQTLTDQGDTFTLTLSLGDSVRKIVWSSQNNRVASVKAINDGKQAIVTSISGGTTLIKCKVTYNDGKTANVNCKVTVKVTAKSIVINNKKLVNGRHVIEVGESYKFISKLYPRNSKDNVYWFIDKTDYAYVNSKGVVTAMKPGYVTLTAVAARNKDNAATSTVRDTVYIEIVNSSDYNDYYNIKSYSDFEKYFEEYLEDNYDIDDFDDLEDYFDFDDYEEFEEYFEDHFDGFDYFDNLGFMRAYYYNHFDFDDDDHDHATDTLNVNNITLTESSKLTITFDKAINSSTVIGTNNNLLNSVIITPKYDSNGIFANILGTLTASLSSDGKVLTVQTSNYFNGLYGIQLTPYIKSTAGIALSEYNKDLTLKDTIAPTYVNYTLDNTGLIVTLNFSEAMNFTNMQLGYAQVTTSGQTMETATANILNTKTSYIPSADKKSLVINLSNMPATDQNKKFSVKIYGVKDLTGNYLNGDTLAFGTSTSARAQAKLVALERTGYYTLTATFDRAIKTPGYVVVNNTESIQGVVDTQNPNKVNYTLSATAALLTNWQKVLIGWWDAYNVLPEDTSSDVLIERNVYFSTFTVLPLPAPTSILQSTNDPSVILIQFNNKLDEVSAKNIANYSIPGTTIVSAELTNNTNTATVKLTLKQGTIITQAYSIIISGIKGYNNSYTVMNEYKAVISLKENSAPVLVSYNYTYPSIITLTFNEKVAGTPKFRVFQNGTEISSSSYINDNTVVIMLNTIPTMNQSLQVFPNTDNVITDLLGNKIATLQLQYIYPTNN